MGVIVSCSKSPSIYNGGVAVTLRTALPQASELALLVDSVTLRIFADDMDTLSFSLPIVKGGVSKTLDIPAGRDRIFEMEASDSSGRVIYFGADTVTIGQGLDQAVNIVLKPVILLMRLSPLYQEVEIGSQGSISVYIFNVDSLFGVAFRLLYDPEMIRIDGSDAGDFLGSDIIILPPEKEDNYYAVGYTRKRSEIYGRIGVSGNGLLATIHFTPLISGTSNITIALEPALIKPDPDADGHYIPVDDYDKLALDGATIVGRGTQ